MPLANLLHNDLSLRPEVSPVLSRANLAPSDLITLSDLPPYSSLAAELNPEKTRWILVDHNAFQGRLGELYGSRVVGCIDHHDEENKVPKECEGEMRIVRKSGSCASLVVEYCREAWEGLSSLQAQSQQQDEETKGWDAELARVALAPVLIDTNDLLSESKTMPVDRAAVEYLESKIVAQEGEKYDRGEFFKDISRAKEDIMFLPLADILRKDYKQWDTASGIKLGVSSIVKDIQSLIQKVGGDGEFLDTVVKFARERELSIVSLMTTSHLNGTFRRELLVWAIDEDGAKAMRKFEGDSRETLGLEKWGEGSLDLEGGGFRRCWWQNKLDNSRKQVAPLLRTSIEETT